jgi:hypothetical protein
MAKVEEITEDFWLKVTGFTLLVDPMAVTVIR